MPDSSRVIARPSRLNYWASAFFFVLGPLPLLMPLFNPPVRNSVGAWIGLGIIAGLVWLFALWCFLDTRKGALIADENGLEQRGAWQTWRVEWHEIEDFYIRLNAPGNNGPRQFYFLEARGKKRRLPHEYGNFSRVLAAIEQRAINARVRNWQPRETRDLLQTSQVFDYGKTRIWPTFLFGLIMGLWFPAMISLDAWWKSGWPAVVTRFTQFGSPLLTAAVLATVFLFCATMSAMVWHVIPALQSRRRFDGQKIGADARGLRWENGFEVVEMRWDEIEWFGFERMSGHLQRPLCVVSSARERIEFHSLIGNSRILRLLIEQNATEAKIKSWGYAPGQDEEILGNPAPRADGIEVFHARTRTNRAILAGGTAIALIHLSNHFWGAPKDVSGIVVGGVLISASAFGWWCFWRCRVEVGSDGVRVQSFWKSNFLSWHEIETLQKDSFLQIGGAGKTLRVSPFMSEVTRLQSVLEKGSGKCWES